MHSSDLEALLSTLRAMQALQWVKTTEGDLNCVWCGAYEPPLSSTCRTGCKLDAAIQKIEKYLDDKLIVTCDYCRRS